MAGSHLLHFRSCDYSCIVLYTISVSLFDARGDDKRKIKGRNWDDGYFLFFPNVMMNNTCPFSVYLSFLVASFIYLDMQKYAIMIVLFISCYSNSFFVMLPSSLSIEPEQPPNIPSFNASI